MKTKMEEIRKAVITHHGGLQGATDAQIKVVWNSLPVEVQKRYLAQNEEGSKRNAVGNKPKRDFRNRS